MPLRHLAVASGLVAVLGLGWVGEAYAQNEPKTKGRPEVCTEQYDPVCGEKNGLAKTYSNACFAAADGAKVVAKGPCK